MVTAQEATGVNAAVTGHFTGPNDMNLIIAKNSKLEVYLVTPEGLQPKVDINIYGKIATIQLFRPPVKLFLVKLLFLCKHKRNTTHSYLKYNS